MTEENLGQEVGSVQGFLSNINVAIIKLTGTLEVGQKIRIKGHTTDFTQNVDSMQIEHDEVKKAKSGQSVGMKVADKCRGHDKVYVIE